MPHDPSLPTNNSLASAAEMRDHLLALHADIQTNAAHADLAAQIADTPHNSAIAQTFAEQGVNFGDFEKQQLADKLGELIVALRRN